MNSLVIGIIIVIGFLTAVILFAVYNSPQESTQPIQEPVLSTQKTWVETYPVDCVNYTNPKLLQGCYIGWLKDYYDSEPNQPMFMHNDPQFNFEANSEYIKDYFGKQGTQILDVWYAIVRQEFCEFGECFDHYKLSILVSDSDVNKMLDLGFKISENPLLIEKTWVSKDTLTQEKYPEDTVKSGDFETIKKYYKDHGITIFDVKYLEFDIWEGVAYVPEHAPKNLPDNHRLYLLVSDNDVNKTAEFGYGIAGEKFLGIKDQKVMWKFIPVRNQGSGPLSGCYSFAPDSQAVYCKYTYLDLHCGEDVYGYLINENGSVVTVKERELLASNAVIDYSECIKK